MASTCKVEDALVGGWGGGGGAGVSSLLLDLGLTTVSPVLHPVTRAGGGGGGGGSSVAFSLTLV